MPSIKIVDVEVNELGFGITVEFDFTKLIGTQPELYHTNISKPNYLFWKEANPAGTIDDYIKAVVRPVYEKLLAQKNLAVQLSLVNKVLAWV